MKNIALLLAFCVVFSIVFAPSVSFAENNPTPYEGPGIIVDATNEDVSVTYGDIVSTSGVALTVIASNDHTADVTTGTLTSDEGGLYSFDENMGNGNIRVTVNGDVNGGVSAICIKESDMDIKIDGDVRGEIGISASSVGGSLEINTSGDVIADNTNGYGMAVNSSEEGITNANIGGDVNGSVLVDSCYESETGVTIGGNINGFIEGIRANSSYDGSTTVTVGDPNNSENENGNVNAITVGIYANAGDNTITNTDNGTISGKSGTTDVTVHGNVSVGTESNEKATWDTIDPTGILVGLLNYNDQEINYGETKVTIDGDVDAVATNVTGIGIANPGTATVDVGGDLTVAASGDESNTATGIYIDSYDDGTTDVNVGGTVAVSSDGTATGLYITTDSVSDEATEPGSVDVHLGGLEVIASGDATGIYATDTGSNLNVNIDVENDVLVTGNKALAIYASNGAIIQVGGDVTGDVSISGQANVTIGETLSGRSTVSGEGSFLQANDINSNDDGLYISAGATATIVGDIVAGKTGINASSSSNVDVTGNVNGKDYGIMAIQSDVSVSGDVESDNIAIVATGQEAEITVGGNVEGGREAVHATGSTVDILGNINSDGTGIAASQANITVGNSEDGTGGSIIAQGTGIQASSNSTVIAEGSIDGKYGVTANSSDVTVKGDITADDVGASARKGSTVTVDGTVDSGRTGVAVYDTSSIIVNNNNNSETAINSDMDGIIAYAGNVTVNGDIVAGHNGIDAEATYGYESGELSTGSMSINVIGNVKAGDHGVLASYTEALGTPARTDEAILIVIDGNIEARILGLQADDVSVVVTGDITTGNIAVDARNGSDVAVGGNVTSTSYNAVSASGSQTKVSIGKDSGGVEVTADKTGILAKENATVEVEGNITSGKTGIESDSSTVALSGEIESGKDGVIAKNGSTVDVGGEINAGIDGIKSENATVNVEGNIIAREHGIVASSGSDIDVQGNIDAENIGIEVRISSADDAQSFITVNGVVNGANKAIELNVEEGINTETVIAALPQIIVQSLETESDLVVVTAPNATVEEQKTVTDALIENIHYIVDTTAVDK